MTGLTRRSLLAGTAAAVAAPAMRASAQLGEVDAIIVGAGAAGIAAARRLSTAGRSYVVLEASQRIGGRCVTDTATFGVPFDRGAHLILTPDVNPITRPASRTGLEIYRAPPSQRVRISRRYARESELEDFLSAVVRSNRAISQAVRGRADMSCAQALPTDLGDWQPSVEFLLGPQTCGKDLNQISAADFARWIERDSGAFCRQGYGTLLAKLAEGVRVQLSTPVTEIDLSRPSRPEVRTGTGTMSARYIICTASTNALVAGKINFGRDVPRRQLDAAAKLQLGSYDHIVLELNGNPLGLQRDDVLIERASGPRTGALLANVAGTPLVILSVGGRFGRELSQQGERAMVDFATEWLGSLYGGDIKKSVQRTRATQWNADPWALGAMSAAEPGAQGSRRILMEAFRDRLYFAGEAAHETMPGTVGGAWESGTRAADTVLRRLSGVSEPDEPRPDAERPTRPQRQQRQPRQRS